MEYTKSKKYDDKFIKDNMMGPNSMKVLEEISNDFTLTEGMRVLDLGCGKGLTSVFLAKEFGVKVFATDLWITASENYNRFKDMGLDNKIIPIHADAKQLPFANEYFDAVISIDSYHYFGNNNKYFDTYLAPLIKKDGMIVLGMPGLKNELLEIPKEMETFWDEEAFASFHSCGWWKNIFSQSNSIDIKSIKELKGFQEPWADWLLSDNEYARQDKEMLKIDAGRYMNLLSVIGKKK